MRLIAVGAVHVGGESMVFGDRIPGVGQKTMATASGCGLRPECVWPAPILNYTQAVAAETNWVSVKNPVCEWVGRYPSALVFFRETAFIQ